MTKFVIDLWLDGYETEEEMVAGCKEFIENALNFSGSSISIRELTEFEVKLLKDNW